MKKAYRHEEVTFMANKAIKTSILLLVALTCIYLFLHSSIFNIDTIKVSGNKIATPEEIVALAEITTGENLFKINRKLIERSVALHPVIKEAQLIRHYPRTAEIKVTERSSWAIIPYEELFLVVDDEGYCLDKLNWLPSGNDMPIVTVDTLPPRINLGQAVESEGITMVKTVWESFDQQDRNKISQFHYISEQKSLLLYTLEGTEIRYGPLERVEEKAANFTEAIKIEETLQAEGKEQIDYVDLRFSGRAVVKTGT